MARLLQNLLLIIAIISSNNYGLKTAKSMPHASEDILEINVDGTTGFLRGKQLTTIGKNERNFITFRNIPFALEPERFMVIFSHYLFCCEIICIRNLEVSLIINCIKILNFLSRPR